MAAITLGRSTPFKVLSSCSNRKKDVYKRQASLLVFILLVGGVQMIILGILGESIGRIFIEVKRRPLYIVEKKVNLDDDE